MNNKWIVLGVIGAVVLIFFLWAFSGYNGLVKSDEELKQSWGNVESSYQRRADLIPNLVNTVKGYADFEKSTLVEVTNARASATQIKVDPSDPASFKKFEAAQNQVSSSLGKLLVVVEKYPDLKANQNFIDLQRELAGTENRINVERRKYNDAVKTYNVNVRRFPRNIIASMFGFGQKPYFESKPGTENAPEVKF
jgi:LemA protein